VTYREHAADEILRRSSSGSQLQAGDNADGRKWSEQARRSYTIFCNGLLVRFEIRRIQIASEKNRNLQALCGNLV
jgi:hypothetical protein